MSTARFSREKKRQLGQFFTPAPVAEAIVAQIDLSPQWRILEPSFGAGAFVFAIADAMAAQMPSADAFAHWRQTQLFGCELDAVAHAAFVQQWRARLWGAVPSALQQTDFFTWMPQGIDPAVATDRRRYFAANMERFDLIIGNPPFGGSISAAYQDSLDAVLGMRDGRKIKKETYAFFIVKSMDLLKPGGELVFICSDTLLTISTMTGLRVWLQSHYTVNITRVPGEFADTTQSMLLIRIKKQRRADRRVTVFGADILPQQAERTPNRSWRINGDLCKYFTGAYIGDKLVATSGMTVGKNELFIRPISNGGIIEPYRFFYEEENIALEKELARARLGKLSDARRAAIDAQIAAGDTERIVKWEALPAPHHVALPHPDYAYYNKASSAIVYAPPAWAVFWKDDGDYVYTFKKNGNWYLHGVGGKKYFGREGLTWPLIGNRLRARYLPPSYILDSGAPCAFLRPGVAHDELFFILGWSLTELANRILKGALNHTRNIQGKDFERLPYPVWVEAEQKAAAINAVKRLVQQAMQGKQWSFNCPDITALETLYAPRHSSATARNPQSPPTALL